MGQSITIAAAIVSMAALAGCGEDTGGTTGVVAGRATMDQVEQACVVRLAGMTKAPASAIRVTESTGSSEGSAVFLDYSGKPWICRADGAGNITAMEFQGEG